MDISNDPAKRNDEKQAKSAFCQVWPVFQENYDCRFLRETASCTVAKYSEKVNEYLATDTMKPCNEPNKSKSLYPTGHSAQYAKCG